MADGRATAPRHGRITFSTAGRVLRQLRHDPRSVGLILLAPVLLLGLLAWVLSGQPGVFDEWGALLLGIFPLLLMYKKLRGFWKIALQENRKIQFS